MNYIRTNLALILLVGVVVFTGIALSFVSQKAHDAQRNVAEKSRDLVAEQWELRALKAEWAYLNRPDRLEELADASHQTKTTSTAMMVQTLDASPVAYHAPLPRVKPAPRAVVKAKANVETPAVVEEKKLSASFANLLDMIGGGR